MRYYYLLATLPDLQPATLLKELDIPETIQLIRDNLEPEGLRQVNYLLYRNDNINFIDLLVKRRKNFNIFSEANPSYFSMTELEFLLRNKYALPEYMSDFLVRFDDQTSSMSVKELEDLLWENYFTEVANTCEGFVRAYSDFDRELRSLVMSSNSRNFPGQDLGSSLATTLKQGKPSEYDVINSHHDELMDALLIKQPKLIQVTMDKIRWDFADQYRSTDFFTLDRVCAIFLKLMTLTKWVRSNDLLEVGVLQMRIDSILANVESLE
ncbi:MAG: DUF2764 family protein [Bacteroidetes bacterium]|nr:DUF2764 family protein [Bacteroidota bacterium]MDA1121113.1 DUF2764 family protein [Bacteroidota bacterium]